MRTTVLALAVVLAALAAACGKNSLPDSPGAPERITLIKKNALARAEEEMKRFQAIEEKYKNDTEEFLCIGHPFDPTIGVFAKVYREWKDARVADIRLSDSLERPYEIDVVYSITVWSTEYEPNFKPDAQELAEPKTEFSPRRDKEIHITYYANMNCEMTDDRGEWPGRESWYSQYDLQTRNINWSSGAPPSPPPAQ